MKKNIIVVITLLICLPYIIRAQSYGDEFTFSVGAGSSGLKYQMEQAQSKLGFGWELGVGYSHYFSRIISFSIGLETEMFGSSVDLKTISFEQQIPTPPGLPASDRFSLKADYDGFNEKQSVILMQIPLMLQFQLPLAEKSFFFLGTGIKVGFPVSSKWYQNTDKLTTAGYSEFTDQLYENMPNHGFSTYPDLQASGKLELKTPVFYALESGLKFNINNGKSLYIGFFLDYGLNDIYQTLTTNAALLEYNNAFPEDYNYNSILSTNHYSLTEGIKPFAAGIKIKIGIGGRKEY